MSPTPAAGESCSDYANATAERAPGAGGEPFEHGSWEWHASAMRSTDEAAGAAGTPTGAIDTSAGRADTPTIDTPTPAHAGTPPQHGRDRRTVVALAIVFVLAAAFYVWTAATSIPFVLDDGALDRYNLLASAFLHLRLSVGPAPAGLLHLANPYNPVANAPFLASAPDAANLRDDVLYGGQLYFVWGPAPALVFLVPMQLLGLEPSGSVTTSFYAIVGLGFALGTLRLLLRAVGGAGLVSSTLAAAALALCTAVPFLLRTPSVTEDTIAGGFCFAMAAVWLLASALSGGRAPLLRVTLMSLCIGLAVGSRTTLAPLALLLVPAYLALRGSRTRARLLVALLLPVGACGVLLLAYNQARFGSPLEFGFYHQLAGIYTPAAHYGSAGYALAGSWLYTFDLPRLVAAFPFILLTQLSTYPLSLPAHYETTEITGGALTLTPILIALAALPWLWRARRAWLGRLGAGLLAVAGAGAATLVLVAYGVFATTERYEVDFSALLLLGALGAWLALARHTRGATRRLVQVGGAALVVWGCVTGFAISFVGYGDYLAAEHPGTWRELQDLGSPLSAVLARLAGHPVLVEVLTPDTLDDRPVGYTTLGTGIDQFGLGPGTNAALTIASPDARTAAFALEMTPAFYDERTQETHLQTGEEGLTLSGGGQAPIAYVAHNYPLRVRIPVHLRAGVNRFVLAPIASTLAYPDRRFPERVSVLMVSQFTLESHY